VAVLNGDDPLVRRIGRCFGGEIVWFGHDRRYEVSAERWRGTLHGMRFELRMGGRTLEVALELAGRHFVSNLLAAAAAAHRLGVEPEQVVEVATSLAPAPHRGQVRRLGQGVTLLDDAYNASPLAVEAAVAALDLAPRGRRVAFLGDMLELGQQGPELHRRTGERVAPKLDAVLAVGPLATGFLEGARRAGSEESSLAAFPDSDAAARAVAKRVEPGDAVLVKGSRGIRMELIVESLLTRFGPREPAGETP
jgi:UDP-N-acetylmuramoyl-tripeptide--D-alanyl-D-alanine ligase